MAVRPIDAEEYIELLKEQYLHHKSMGNSQAAKAWQGAMQLLYDMPTLTPTNEWVSVKDRLPTLPGYDHCSVMVNTAYKNNPKSCPMIYERSVVRGKRVERWKYYWDRIADEPPDYWMPLPEPPNRRPPEGEEDK